MLVYQRVSTLPQNTSGLMATDQALLPHFGHPRGDIRVKYRRKIIDS